MEQNERDKMIVDNIGLVHMICRKLHVPAEQYEDCLQEGIIGLIEAVDKFDETKGFQFSTFAYWDVIGKIGTYATGLKQLDYLVGYILLNVNT